jgi:hypothetical protein
VGLVGETTTRFTGASCTLTVEVPEPVPEDAVMTALPTDTPVTTPLDDTTATEELLVDHDTGALVMALPFASLGVATSVTVQFTFTDAGDGEIVTLATDGAATFTVTDPLCPSLVAVTVVVPEPVAVITPPDVTVATFVLALDQVIVRPVNTLPLASRVVAVTVWLPPTVRLTVLGVTVTVATGAGGGGGGAVTVTEAVPDCPSLVAVMVALPAPVAVITPLDVTVATFVFELDQDTDRPVNTLPLASRVVAVTVCDPPTVRFTVLGATVTDATGTGGGGADALTVTVEVPNIPSLVPVMVTTPALTPVTTPLGETTAMALSLLDQLTARPVRVLPLASSVVAVSCTVEPMSTAAVDGDTFTVATGTAPTVIVAVPT